jgi:hypothetical protein
VFSNLFSALCYRNTTEGTPTSRGDAEVRSLRERIDNQGRRGCCTPLQKGPVRGGVRKAVPSVGAAVRGEAGWRLMAPSGAGGYGLP